MNIGYACVSSDDQIRQNRPYYLLVRNLSGKGV